MPFDELKRREFIALLGGAAAAWPLAAHAQQSGKISRVGFLGPSLDGGPPRAHYEAFLAQLRDQGFSDGQNVIVEHRSLQEARGPFVAAAELMRQQPDVVVALGPEVALKAAIGAGRGVPIVMVAINYDPIERGYIASLAKPGGNITGVVYRQPELAAKQVELLTQAFPGKTRLAILWDAQTADQWSAAERIATSLRLEVQGIKLENPPYDIDAAFRHIAAGDAQMLLVQSSPFFIPLMSRIAGTAIQRRLPAMFTAKQWTAAGGLMSYGVDFFSMYRRAADYVARILKGAKPVDLPVELPTKFELIANLKTAKAIGVELPTAILVRADEVIE